MACGVACHGLGNLRQKRIRVALVLPQVQGEKSAAHFASVKNRLKKVGPDRM
jgi:hypothetical protein